MLKSIVVELTNRTADAISKPVARGLSLVINSNSRVFMINLFYFPYFCSL